MDFTKQIASELNLNPPHVEAAIGLIDEGNTIPFIARYRKEATGSMDDQALRELGERLEYLRNLQKRKEEAYASIEEQEKMTDDIAKALQEAVTLSEVEDVYRPFRPKRRTRGSVARERGLEPLALQLLEQNTGDDPELLAQDYVSEEKELPTTEEVLAGARDVLAEDFSDNADTRNILRELYWKSAAITSEGTTDEESVYDGFYEFSEPISKIAGHRVLAINRGEKEDFLRVSVEVDSERAIHLMKREWVKNSSLAAKHVNEAVEDSYARLIHPSIEREVRSELTESASEGAIKVFGENLRQLLLQPPIRGKVAMGLDPGYRTGCKVAVVDATGMALDTDVIYPVEQFGRIKEAEKTTKRLIKKHGVEIIAIGNGTASRETEQFTVQVLRQLADEDIHPEYMIVSEAGASVYSASKLAAEEFPQYDVSLRSAVSIARRLQDPLAELVKIDPKAVGVGQYQHDMPAARLAETLDGVVEDCVNTVGVELNTASAPLLERVAGLTAATAKNVVLKREKDGPFKSRKELLDVTRLGPKAFEQSAGFLRLPDAINKLDATAVHPESYKAASKLLEICGFTEDDIGTDTITTLPDKSNEFGLTALAKELDIGKPTLRDIIDELLRPGRDIRDSLPPPMLRSDVLDMEDLQAGMELTGTVRNVVDFGAFVDIGVGQDGLVHVSQIANHYVTHPAEELSVGDIVTVWVMQVDIPRKRISLTMVEPDKQDSY